MSQMKAIVDKLLTNVSSLYAPTGYISESLFPKVQVVQKSGKLGKYGMDHIRIEGSFVGGRGGFRRVESITRSTQTYNIESHGLEELVTEDDYRNVELPFEAEKDVTMGVTSLIWTEKEKILADSLANTSVVTQNVTLSGTSQFSDYVNSDPISRFSTARAAIKSGCGAAPNVVFMDWTVKNKLKFHPQLLDMLGFKQARPGGLNDSELAMALDVQKVIVADASYNSAKEGQTATLAPIWGKHLWFAVLPETAAVRQISAGYYFTLTGKTPRKVYKYAVNNPPESNAILVKDDYDYILSNTGAIYLIKDAIA